jgi:hypothetical protein
MVFCASDAANRKVDSRSVVDNGWINFASVAIVESRPRVDLVFRAIQRNSRRKPAVPHSSLVGDSDSRAKQDRVL